MTLGEARPADVPALADLLGLLFAQEAEFAPDRERQIAGLRAIVGHPEVGTVLVLRDADGIAGMVNVLYTISTALGGRAAILEDVIVRPDRRGSGAGSRLVEAAIAHARAAGCLRMTLVTDAANPGAQRLYRRHGFAPSSMLTMRLALEPRSATMAADGRHPRR